MRLIGLLSFISIMQLSCDDSSPEIEIPTLSISIDSLGYITAGGILDIAVMSELIWTAVDTSDWIMVQGDTLLGQGKLIVTVDENMNEYSRESTVFIYAGGNVVSLKVHQQAFIHPALMPLDIGLLIIEEGSEIFNNLLNTPELSISEIEQCGEQPSSNSHNVVLLDANTSRISITWNHINTASGEWEGIT